MAIQFDLPDFGTTRQVTDDPIININQAVNVSPFDSGIKDVNQFTHLHVAATATLPTGVYQLTILFFPALGGTSAAFTETVFLKGQAVWHNVDYPMVTRYVQFKLSELTATGNSVILRVSPSSGPSTSFQLPLPGPLPSFGTVNNGASTTYDPSLIFRGLWRLYVFSRTPQWQVNVFARDFSGSDTLILNLKSGAFTLPLDTVFRPETASIYVTFTNQWTFPVSVYLYMVPIGV